MKTFWIRTASAAVYAALFLGCIFSGELLGSEFWGNIILLLFALFVAMGGTFEFFRMVEKQGARPNKVMGYLYIAVMFLGMMASCWEVNSEVMLVVAFVMIAGLLLVVPFTLILQLWSNSEHPFADALYTILPIFYIAIPLLLMPVLNDMKLLLLCVLMVWVNDSFAYMGGSLVGKHKMWPRHSPGKTWEGTAIGVAACVALGIFVGPLLTPYLQWYDGLFWGLICGVVGTLGDLVESMLKRSTGVKDSGNIMPGHGGFLDRFDSLLVIIPFVLVYSMFFIH